MSFSRDNSRTIVFLTGGLGNQLFQLAAAISRNPEEKILLSTEIGIPRRNKKNNPEIVEYLLNSNISFIKGESYSGFMSKVFGYNIRSSKYPTALESHQISQTIVRFITSLMFSIRYKLIGQVITENNFTREWKYTLFKNKFLIGYFQNAKWIEGSREILLSLLNLCNPSIVFSEIKKTETENILVIHIRRGDYRNEVNFGLIHSNYYLNAFKYLEGRVKISQIWLFSDEPSEALSLLRPLIPVIYPIKLIPNETLSSAETLQLMRCGTNFIIGNSTFGWWGAFMSNYPLPVVVAPNPWFKTQGFANPIYPNSWIRMNAEFE